MPSTRLSPMISTMTGGYSRLCRLRLVCPSSALALGAPRGLMASPRFTLNLHLYNRAFPHETRILTITRSLRTPSIFSAITILAPCEGGLPESGVLDEGRQPAP